MVTDFAAAGLGLQYGTVRLVPADAGWTTIARELAEDIGKALARSARAVEHIGSTAVPGLLAKPIIDLAIGVDPGADVRLIAQPMSRLGWVYRGDAGSGGGWVFAMEDTPWHRVADAHGVEFGGARWVRYLKLRQILRESPTARQAYEAAKAHAAAEQPDGLRGYVAGKDATVRRLLEGDV